MITAPNGLTDRVDRGVAFWGAFDDCLNAPTASIMSGAMIRPTYARVSVAFAIRAIILASFQFDDLPLDPVAGTLMYG